MSAETAASAPASAGKGLDWGYVVAAAALGVSGLSVSDSSVVPTSLDEAMSRL